MEKFEPNEHPHIRYNPLKDDWILVSPHRTKRPWKGLVEKPQDNSKSSKRFDPSNPLCPGAVRPNGVKNPEYTDTFVFDNDFPALLDMQFSQDCDEKSEIDKDLFKMEPVSGACKVMCFHPYSDLTLPLMSREAIVAVINKWIEIVNDLKPKYDWVQIFENKGAINGCSNPHPHCQIWSTSFLPNEIKVKHQTQKAFYEKHNKVMLVEYLQRELKSQERVIVENEHWACVVPYWAMWPFETMLIPKRHVVRIFDLSSDEISSLADVMKRLLIKYDNLFECSFPYTMGWHFAPTGSHLDDECKWWQLHAVYYPPLLRSATIKKFMVGFEQLAQAQRDLTPEKAAESLKALSDTVHYTQLNNNS